VYFFFISFYVGADHAQELDATLLPRTYVAANYFTAADLALYGTLYPIIVRFLNIEREEQDRLTPILDKSPNFNPLNTIPRPA
jgi:aminoacyl tRNA synthase complex-interacting multifunctional protein 1